MPQTDRVQVGSYVEEEEVNLADEEDEGDDYDSDASMPELPRVDAVVEDVEDVWDGEPNPSTDNDDCNFLGFRKRRMNGAVGGKHNATGAQVKAKPPLRRFRRKRRGRRMKAFLAQVGSGTTVAVKPKVKRPRKKHDFTCSSPNRRGQNGWEDSLRPRPQQVQHYQSILMMRKRKAESELGKNLLEMKRSQLSKAVEEMSFKQEVRATEMEPELSSEYSLYGEVVGETVDNVDRIGDGENGGIVNGRGGVKNGGRTRRGRRRKYAVRGRPPMVGSRDTQQEDAEEGELLLAAKDTRANSRKQVSNGIVVQKPDGSEQDSDTEPRLDASVGEVVWAKLGSTRWWPAMLIWGSDCGQQPARLGQTWVFWFGDHKISEVPRDRLADYTVNFNAKYAEGGSKTFKRGVVEAIRECAARAGVQIPDSDSGALLEWAKQGFRSKAKNDGVFLPNPDNPIPMNVRKYLTKIKDLNLLYFQTCDPKTAQVAARTPRNECLDNKDSALKKVKDGFVKIEEVCIACDSDRVPITTQHPLFVGGLCKQCKDDIIETMYAFGEDGTNAYCVICGNAGELLICDNNDCNRVYCTGCIELMVSPEACKKVLEMSPWLCYLCAEYDEENNGLIQRQKDWQQNITQLFQPEKHIQLPNMEDYKEKRSIRVLSLFDGIGTGRFVLDQLGIEIETYFSSEVDVDAMNVVNVQHRHNVEQLGNIEMISDSEIAKYCPIDLVMGGSPCNDLSLVNPARKGLYDPSGTGKLFFDFFRILKVVQLANQGRHVFWLYENVASMPQEYKTTISRFLQVPPITIVGNSSCEPSVLDSKHFSPQNRARYFWGNIPGMYTPLQPHHLQQNVTLDNVLTPNMNRKAVVEKIRTVTTRSNSLKQGKKCILPVMMNGEGDVLWVTELELVFGFPKHYTDVGNIPLGRRQQLLGKAWSVPVIKHILTPLRNFFKTGTSATTSNTTANYSTTNTNVNSF